MTFFCASTHGGGFSTDGRSLLVHRPHAGRPTYGFRFGSVDILMTIELGGEAGAEMNDQQAKMKNIMRAGHVDGSYYNEHAYRGFYVLGDIQQPSVAQTFLFNKVPGIKQALGIPVAPSGGWQRTTDIGVTPSFAGSVIPPSPESASILAAKVPPPPPSAATSSDSSTKPQRSRQKRRRQKQRQRKKGRK